MPTHQIEVGAAADLTFYQLDAEWTVAAKDIQSKSANSPLIGRSLLGRPLAVVNGDQLFLNTESK